MSERIKGVVKWYNESKGFGFLTPSKKTADGRDHFFHVSELQRAGVNNVADNQPVEYEVAQGKKGLEARAIKLLVA